MSGDQIQLKEIISNDLNTGSSNSDVASEIGNEKEKRYEERIETLNHKIDKLKKRKRKEKTKRRDLEDQVEKLQKKLTEFQTATTTNTSSTPTIAFIEPIDQQLKPSVSFVETNTLEKGNQQKKEKKEKKQIEINDPTLKAGESSIKITIERYLNVLNFFFFCLIFFAFFRQKSFGETLSKRQINLIVLALCLG